MRVLNKLDGSNYGLVSMIIARALPHLAMRHANDSVFAICISWIALTSKRS